MSARVEPALGLAPPFEQPGEHIGLELGAAQVLFTTRRGGVSEGPFQSLNLGLWTDDDPRRVSANRARLAELVGVPRERFVQGRQVHGTVVQRHRTAPSPLAEPAPADGQVTNQADVATVVLVADCLPVALACAGAVGMVHAGWRGLAGGVLEEALAALCDVGGGGPVQAAIGPGAGGCCYEVGDQVAEAFADLPGALAPGSGRRRLDLKAAARRRLEQAGVETVHDVGLCTLCSDPALFFSHRRDGGRTGRQAGVAWLA